MSNVLEPHRQDLGRDRPFDRDTVATTTGLKPETAQIPAGGDTPPA
jgi:hypothetical protein